MSSATTDTITTTTSTGTMNAATAPASFESGEASVVDEVAEETVAQSGSVEDDDEEEEEQRPSLLREWNHHASVSASASASASAHASSAAPPVAPAVVLNAYNDSNDEDDNGSVVHPKPAPTVLPASHYPVATFVSNLMRTSMASMDEIRDGLSNHMNSVYASAIPETQYDGENANGAMLSTRSEPPTCSYIPSAAAATSQSSQFHSMGELMHDDDTSEFVLIDGDLVSVPCSTDQQQLEWNQQRELRQQNRGSGRMRKSVKGLKKWMKKKKLGRKSLKQDLQDHISQSQSELTEDAETETLTTSAELCRRDEDLVARPMPCSMEDLLPAARSMEDSMEDLLPTTKSAEFLPEAPRDLSSPKRVKPKKKKRLAWLRDIESRDSDVSTKKAAPLGQSLRGKNASTKKAAPLGPRPRLLGKNVSTKEASPLGPRTSLLGGTSANVPLAPMSASVPIEPPALKVSSLISLDLPPAQATAAVATAQQQRLTLDESSATFDAQASFIGDADQLLEAGVIPDSGVEAYAYIEDRLDDYDKYDKKDAAYGYPYLTSVVPRDADYKVDKQDAPCVDSMLRRAEHFAEDLEASEQETLVLPAKLKKLKSDGGSVPLSMASAADKLIHNDILKLVMVGAPNVDKSSLARALRKSTKKPRKRTTLGVDVHSWTPSSENNISQEPQVKFSVWDVQGAADANNSYSANFGAHPGTQSLFFSDRSLYLLVWDLAANNRNTKRRGDSLDYDGDTSSDEEEEGNEYQQEESNRQADRALQTDIEERVLSWVDCIARRGPNSAVLPIAIVPTDMSPQEAKRRCDTMSLLLMDYTQHKIKDDLVPPKVLMGAETIICVSLDTNMGMDALEETILAIATDSAHSVFDHVGTPVPIGTMHVLETAKRMKQDHKLVLVDHLMAELNSLSLTVDDVMEALHFLSSIGELLYFGGIDVDDVLSRYVILSRKWMVSALSCILRNDLKRELTETRRFMRMQCIYSDQQFTENQVTQTFSTSTSSCPLLSSTDTQMLWQSMSFMREAADKSAQLSENSTTASTMFGFLEHLLVHTGVFLPLGIDCFASPDPIFFVPSLLSQADTRDVWTYKSSDAWMTTLSHSWLFRDGAPVGLMEHVTVALLRDLHEFSHTIKPLIPPQRSQTFPLVRDSLTDFVNSHEGEVIGNIKIHQIMCWKSSLLVKIACVFPDGNELRESFVEVFVSIADQSSPHCVATDAMRSSMQRLIVSGKGQVGHHGRKMWKGGYGLIIDSIKASVAHCTNVDRQVVCPECLAHAHPSGASTWSWDSVRAAAETGSSLVRCIRGHRVDANLICGTISRPAIARGELGSSNYSSITKKQIRDLLPSIVVVGLWDSKARVIRSVGSGFVVDKKQGLVVTAGHIFFQMEGGRQFGTPYFGLKHAKAVIGVIPEGSNDTAVFRYFAEIVADDIHNTDACVLRITTRMEHDVDNDGLVGEQPETPVNVFNEELVSLKMTRKYELEEAVRILGFNQGGEGLLERGKHVNRSADFAKGYICKQFKVSDDHSDGSLDSSSGGSGFSPREEIVVMCPTISGHSGGPCVNEEGKVVGILSRGDPVDRQRCYLVPACELKMLVAKARKNIAGVGDLKAYATARSL